MDLRKDQKVYIVMEPSIYGFTAKKSFQIIEGRFLYAMGDKIFVTIELQDNNIPSTMMPVYDKQVFTNAKGAIDYATINHFNNEVDKRPTTSPSIAEPVDSNKE